MLLSVSKISAKETLLLTPDALSKQSELARAPWPMVSAPRLSVFKRYTLENRVGQTHHKLGSGCNKGCPLFNILSTVAEVSHAYLYGQPAGRGNNLSL